MRTRFVAGLCALAIYSNVTAQPAPGRIPEFVANQLIVGFEPGTPGLAIADAHRAAGTAVVRSLAAISADVVNVPATGEQAAMAAYDRNPNVRYVERNTLRPLRLPDEGNDPPPPFGLGIDYFEEQYGLHNHGQSFFYDQLTGEPGAIVGVADADIDAPEAWDLHTGSAAVTVAVLDSGVDCAHPDLAGKCVENVNLGPSDTLDDVIGHGTHVAGIIGATGDNGIGVAGVSWATTIASIKVCYEYYDFIYGVIGLCDAAASAAGMIHAADQGYQVLNMSFAGPTGSQAEADAAAYAWQQGTLLVAAAANAYERTPMYPAAFNDVIGVAATDWFDNLAGFSNFGDWVSMAAPGVNVFSTLPNAACGLPSGGSEGCYGWLSGTSMASPTVAGAAALVWAYLGASATNDGVRTALENSADTTGAMGQNMLAWTRHGRLNVHNAMDSGGVVGPGDPGVHVGDLDAIALTQGRNWSARVTVSVHDENELPVDGVTVQGLWSTGSMSACTTVAGSCVLDSVSLAKRDPSITFSISSLVGDVYQPSVNHDPDGDSDGRSITIVR